VLKNQDSSSRAAKSRNALDKVLHPDTRKQATKAEIDEACKGWNVWKNSNNKARRRAR